MVRKLRFAPNLYWGLSLRADMEAGINTAKTDKLKKKLEKNPQFTGLFVLAAAENPEKPAGNLFCKAACPELL